MIEIPSKIVDIRDHPEYDRYLKSVRASQEKRAQETGLSYEEYTDRLNLGFED